MIIALSWTDSMTKVKITSGGKDLEQEFQRLLKLYWESQEEEA